MMYQPFVSTATARTVLSGPMLDERVENEESKVPLASNTATQFIGVPFTLENDPPINSRPPEKAAADRTTGLLPTGARSTGLKDVSRMPDCPNARPATEQDNRDARMRLGHEAGAERYAALARIGSGNGFMLF